MYPSRIPHASDVERVLLETHNVPRTYLGLVYNFGWNRRNTSRFGSAFAYRSPMPSRLISIRDSATLEQARQTAIAREQTYYREHHELDELYHWLTAFTDLPEPTKENVIIRITHPLIVYSMITQLLVSDYKDQHGIAETKELLKLSVVKWNKDCQYPVKKWRLVHNQPSLDFWPNTNASTHLRNWITSLPALRDGLTRTTQQASFLQSYNAKATDHFNFKYGKHPAYKLPLGIELELETLTSNGRKVLTDHLSQHAIFKRDGSVSGGVEICTAPATLDVHKDAFKGFFNDLPGSGLQALNNCGLHVHIERKNVKPPQMAKLLRFMNHPDNNNFIETLAGRSANNYCATQDYNWESGLQAEDSNKYRRVNLANEKTIEFRLFASTTDFKQFTRCLDFVQAVMDYTKPGVADCSIKEFLNKDSFIKFVDKERQHYPDLYKYLHNVPEHTYNQGVI